MTIAHYTSTVNILIRPRFINLGDPARPLSTEDPTFDTYLPVDDAAWGDSVRLVSSPYTTLGNMDC